MAVKYVKDFEFSADRGFHKSAEPMKAKASIWPLAISGGMIVRPAPKMALTICAISPRKARACCGGWVETNSTTAGR